MRLLPLFLLLLIFACKQKETPTVVDPIPTEPDQVYYQAISLLGDTLIAKAPSEALMEKFLAKQKAYLEKPESLDDLIWYGRFTAYTGDYLGAIDIYTKGLDQFPEQSRLLRHRGHRYISIREFDKAIADLSKAAQLIEGKENTMEADGMPNNQNTPISSKHGNIYYHLGLAYYLKGDFKKASEAYIKALMSGTNTDNVASTTHWLYMIFRRMEEPQRAEAILLPISKEMEVIENQSYLDACLFYKGFKTLEEVYKPQDEANPSNSALKYAIGNWHYYNGNVPLAKEIFKQIVAGDDWSSFGYIAAETDLARMQEAL